MEPHRNPLITLSNTPPQNTPLPETTRPTDGSFLIV